MSLLFVARKTSYVSSLIITRSALKYSGRAGGNSHKFPERETTYKVVCNRKRSRWKITQPRHSQKQVGDSGRRDPGGECRHMRQSAYGTPSASHFRDERGTSRTVELTISWVTTTNWLSSDLSISSCESPLRWRRPPGDFLSPERELSGMLLLRTSDGGFLLPPEELQRERFVEARLVTKSLRAGRLPTMTAGGHDTWLAERSYRGRF